MDFLEPRIPLGDWAEAFLDWFEDAFGWLISGVTWLLDALYDNIEAALTYPHFLIMIIIFTAVAWLAASWKLAIFTLLGFYLLAALDQWETAMSTVSLVIVAVIFALLLALPIGILAAKSQVVSTVVRPILDFMQSMPALAYLVPAIVMFGVGQVPGAIATIIFAMPPGVRLTELAIRQVDREVVEAGHAFGASEGHILGRVQLPLAMPTIMAGVNQVIMLALSMVVLAGMAGAGGLGGQVMRSISSLDVPLGVEAGLAVVIIAIYLDRVTAALGARSPATRAAAASTG